MYKYLIILLLPINIYAQSVTNTYTNLQKGLAQGWNTWNTKSDLSYVYLPNGVAINLWLKNVSQNKYLKKALIGTKGVTLNLLEHSYDGSYSELTLKWDGIGVKVQSATKNGNEVLEITPYRSENKNGIIIIKPSLLWGLPGIISRYQYSKKTDINTLFAYTPYRRFSLYANGEYCNDSYRKKDNKIFEFKLNREVTISTGNKYSVSKINHIIKSAKQTLLMEQAKYGRYRKIYHAMQNIMAWNTIYDPSHQRVITPVSRAWNVNRGGYALFEWDTFFGSYMISLSNKDLAYANIIALLNEVAKVGFVPGLNSGDAVSRDRSKPPIGSFIVKEIYQKYHDKWFLKKVFKELLTWNRWWAKSRIDDGYLCWGTTPYPGIKKGIHYTSNLLRAKWESGLDNSPMYDNVPFDTLTNTMQLADVGLMSLYVNDCKSLAYIAKVLNKNNIAEELTNRASHFSDKLETLWDPKSGIFLNKRLDTDQFSHIISPTNFYPILAGVASKSQVKEMLTKYFFNPKEFWGKYIMPSISRSDPAFKDNNYWRGRIWGPMNFLVYMGLQKYHFPEANKARKALVDKSRKLFLNGWNESHSIYENYNATTGKGNDVSNSDHFYTWGALLGYMSLIQDGWMKPTAQNLNK